MEYRVTWTIDLDAKNAQDAAEQALAIQRRPDSAATFFTCETDSDLPVEIDLGHYSANLGHRQLACLRCPADRGSYPGSWGYKTHGATVRILNALATRGLVDKESLGYRKGHRYTINDAGRKVLET